MKSTHKKHLLRMHLHSEQASDIRFRLKKAVEFKLLTTLYVTAADQPLNLFRFAVK